jgi:hypothetical protein
MIYLLRKGKGISWAMRPCLKESTTYLIILVVVSLLLVGVRLTFTDSMVIYAQKNKPDFMQIFFPIDGAYSEVNSERSTLVGNLGNGVSIVLPRASVDHIRVDPANEAGDIFIKKIELRHLFGTETFMPNDLLTHAKPIQMIDKFEVTPAGLLIHSTGNDPLFELQLNKSTLVFQCMMLFIICVSVSLAVFLVIKKSDYLKMPVVNKKAYLLVIPLLASLGIAALFYPGFMSYDTLHALRSARNEVTDSMWPPMVSYVWRAVDLVSPNPSSMHFSQVFLLIFSIFFIIFHYTKKISYATLFILVYLSIPVVLGTVAVIWKDVLMAAFFLAGFAVIVSMRLVVNRWWFLFLSLLVICLIFLGVCSRHNAIIGAVPLLFYLALIMRMRIFIKYPLNLCLSTIVLGSLLTGAVFVAKTQLDNYSLPGFVKLNNSNDEFIQTVRVLDVAGASLCMGRNLFADMVPNLSLAEISSGYDPRHINFSKGILEKVPVDSRISKIWVSVAVHHPICFFNNKFELTKYMVGANQGGQFIITAPSIDKNEYGYSLPESSLRDAAVTYIVNASNLPFYKPWFLYLISIGAFVYMARVRALTADYLTIYLSAIFYFAGLVMFGNAADARLPFYTTTALSMFTFISILEFKKRHK